MITVLRLGHRPARDKRITTHVGLVARAFNANRMLVDKKDEKLETTLQSVVSRFGGSFDIKTGVGWRKVLQNWQGKIIHLTMYGEHVDNVIDNVSKEEELLIVIGSEKVPRDVYDMADYNVAIGHQPHSEVAALAIFLDRLYKGKELKKKFNGKVQILDCPKGKIVEEIVEE